MSRFNFIKLISIIMMLNYVGTAQTTYTSIASGEWDNSIIWSPTGVPGAGDNVYIDQQTIVSTNGQRDVAGFSILVGGELLLTGTDGSLTIAGNASWGGVPGGGIIRDGSSNNNGVVLIANSAIVDITGNQYAIGLYGGVTVLNQGTIRMRTNFGVFAIESSVIENHALFEIDTEAGYFTGIPNGGTFINTSTGTLRKISGMGACIFNANWNFQNLSGNIDVQTGSIVFGCDGLFSGGTYNADAGALLHFDVWNQTFEGTLSGSPAGRIEISAGVTANTGTTGVTLDFQGTGFAWSGGTFDSSMITIPSTGLLVLDEFSFSCGLSGGTKLTNLGTIRQDENLGFFATDSSIIDNQSLYEIVADYGSFGGTLNGGFFINSGTFRNLGSGTCTVNANWNFQNLAGGIIDVASGLVDIDVFENTQDANVQGNASINVPVAFTNNGITSPGSSAGTLTYIRDYNPSETGVLDIELGGLTAGSDYDHLNITGDANLNGTLNISQIDGFVPAPGDSFLILTTTGSVTDSFSTILKPAVVEFDIHYNSNNITLIVTSVTGIENSDFEDHTLIIPEKFKLNQNFPNPFNPTTTIRYGLPKTANVRLTVYDVQGKKVVTLVDGISQQAGYHQVSWNGTNYRGYPVSSGVYIYQIETGQQIIQRRMLMIK